MAHDPDDTNSSFSWFGPIAVGEERHEYEEDAVRIPVSILLVLCLVMSVFGNVCTCAVIIRDRSMRTPTNCYLFNIAIADLLTTLFIPFEMYVMWAPEAYPFGQVGCIVHFLVWECLSNCSLLTIAAFTVERYLAVSRPFLRQKLTLKPRVYKIVAVNWLVSAGFSIPDVFLTRLYQKNDQTYCYTMLPFHLKLVIATEMCVFFVMPMTIIFVLYILIAIKIKSMKASNGTSPVNGKQYRDKTIMMLAAVAATFFFCWFPVSLLRLVMISPLHNWANYDKMVRTLRYLCLVNVYIYTAVNPILYSLMSRKFSRAFKDLLHGRRRNTVFSTSIRHATTAAAEY
ncbi:neuromedin-U receptor 2-like [Leguminivora glycinivorella]|uniref:neuromedin-U receptor 2-like n=1 Tax=Leguminivora glycinivorella TaxID=1035111 RepID=UPI002010C66E|nr:neuromedin-U receptor 2-like [Leguminivora glycinivorella]